MKTEILTLSSPKGHEKELEHAASVLRSGGLVVFPTETVYGIGGDATNEHAAARIYEAKGRPSDNPLIIHVADPADAEPYAVTNDTYYKLAAQFMPGPLTVILPRRERIPLSVTGGLQTVAVRCPSHPVANALIRAAGVPIAAPSANLSGRPSPTLASHVIEDLSGRVEVIIDGGECEVGLESTIIALDGDRGTLLRPGAITYDALCCVCSEVTIAPACLEQLSADARPLSPGMKYRHYAPRASLVLLDGDVASVTSFLVSAASRQGVGILCYDEEQALFRSAAPLFPIGHRDDLGEQAHRLFAALRAADEHADIHTLYAHLPPREGIGLALYNRLIRAAAHTVLKV
ncbi:MAG: threonylcarbamoyl-AMP synthase [Ruminococcaceae bacterium]|nr:threonylcarbamoyl-AMP synthase [Oscillospiraceae bacterium]